MAKRKAPYTHRDGSDCWTKGCSLNHRKSGGENHSLQEVSTALARLDSLFDKPATPTGCECGHPESDHGNIGAKQCLRWVGGQAPDNRGAVPCGCKSFGGVSDGKNEREYRERRAKARALLNTPVDPLEELVGSTESPMNETEGDYDFWQGVYAAQADGALTLPIEVSHPELNDIDKNIEDTFDSIIKSNKDMLEDTSDDLPYRDGHQPQ